MSFIYNLKYATFKRLPQIFDLAAFMRVMSSLYGSSAPPSPKEFEPFSHFTASDECRALYHAVVGVGDIVQLSQSMNSTLPRFFM